jgi:hypothetical protein
MRIFNNAQIQKSRTKVEQRNFWNFLTMCVINYMAKPIDWMIQLHALYIYITSIYSIGASPSVWSLTKSSVLKYSYIMDKKIIYRVLYSCLAAVSDQHNSGLRGLNSYNCLTLFSYTLVPEQARSERTNSSRLFKHVPRKRRASGWKNETLKII